jgi:hypothetical protein
MQTSKTRIIYEKTDIININKNLFTNLKKNKEIKENKENKEYSLNQNIFDPLKSSPPNDFMIKLYMRNFNYNS